MKHKIAMFVLYYLRFLAKLQLRKNKNAKIIGITGSAGKSSTRNALYSILKDKYKVKASFKANSESGIPLDILGLEMHDYSLLDWLRVLCLAPIKLLSNFEKFDYYLVEMGIDSPKPPKNMDFLLSIIRPKMAIFLNASWNHGFAFDQLVKEKEPEKRKAQIIQAIAKEKAKLVLTLPKTGLAFLNYDDQNVKELCQNTAATIYSFGQENICDLQILDHQIKLKGQQISSIFTFQIQNHYGKIKGQSRQLTIQVNNYFLAKHYAQSFAAAILVGLKAGLEPQMIKTALENHFNLPTGRASIIKGKNNSLIIDSSYNASSMQDLLSAVIALGDVGGRKIALLGDMRELGEQTQKAHEDIAQLAAGNFAQIFLVGAEMKKYALPIIAKKQPNQVTAFEDAATAGSAIAQILKPGDVVLVKGSQNTIFLEEAVKKMMTEEKEAGKLLCRQSNWWLKVKQQIISK